ncbi:MAG: serine hydrolase [Verrucomicrobiota bacterium]
MNSKIFRPVIIALLLTASLAGRAADSLPRSTPEAQGVSSQVILKFVQSANTNVDTMHSFMILRHGQVVSEGWWKPEAADKPHILNSVTKSFTSTAVGLAIRDGKLSLDDKVLKFFPDDAPANPSDNLKTMTVRDLITMTCGHETEAKTVDGEPTVKQFLAHPVPHKPGTYFKYNTLGSYVLSAIVTKVTGQTALDYLTPRLFEPLGIESPRWNKSAEGVSMGGHGLYLRTEDIAKFGQLLLQKGKWNGKQLIPQDWIEAATSKQVSNAVENRSQGLDWQQGYGFQFWQCQHRAYRGDGAGGQFCIVIPELDVVIATTAQTQNMQGILDVIWDSLLPAFQDGTLPDDAASQEKLKAMIANLCPQTKKK